MTQKNQKRWKSVLLRVLAAVLCLTAVHGAAVFCPTAAHAAEVERQAGKSMNSAVRIGYNTDYVSHFSDVNENGWFSFTTKDKAGFYQINLRDYSTEGYVFLSLFEKSGEVIAMADSYLESPNVISMKLSPNTAYYLRASTRITKKQDAGAYCIRLSYRADPQADSHTKAIRLPEGTPVRASMDGGGDVDWFKYKAPFTGKYTLQCTAQILKYYAYGRLHVFTPDGQLLSEGDAFNEESSLTAKTVSLQKGKTYYISIRSNDLLYNVFPYTISIQNHVVPKSIRLNRTVKVTLKKGATTTLRVKKVSPANASKAVRWVSNNMRVVQVDPSGVVTAVGKGTATVTAVSTEKDSVKASCTFKVSGNTASK